MRVTGLSETIVRRLSNRSGAHRLAVAGAFRPEQLLSAHQVCLSADDDHCHGRRGASGV
jgi:hypothetical protein